MSAGPADRPARGLWRVGWVVAGLACVALGGVGVVVPGLPTTVFFIGAAACFSRSLSSGSGAPSGAFCPARHRFAA